MVHRVHGEMTVTFEDREENVRKHNGRVKCKFQVRNAQTILNGVDTQLYATHLDFSAGTSTARGDPVQVLHAADIENNIDRSVAVLLPLRGKGNTVFLCLTPHHGH